MNTETTTLKATSTITPASPLSLAAQKLIESQRRAVLLVEDTAAHAAILRRALSSQSWVVEHTTRASSAVESFAKDSARVVLLDLSLPDANGIDLLNQLLQINREALVIVVTASEDVNSSVEAMKQGAVDYVVKADPQLSIDRILNTLERVWKGRITVAENLLLKESRQHEQKANERQLVVKEVTNELNDQLKNPLSAIYTFSQLLARNSCLDHETKGLIQSLIEALAVLERTVKQFSKQYER